MNIKRPFEFMLNAIENTVIGCEIYEMVVNEPNLL